jgi:hypothetical protein
MLVVLVTAYTVCLAAVTIELDLDKVVQALFDRRAFSRLAILIYIFYESSEVS